MEAYGGKILPVLLILCLSSPVMADLRQLIIATSNGGAHPQNNRIFRMPLEGEDIGQLIEFAGPGDGIAAPYAIAVHPNTHRLYVANNDTCNILEFEINADGTKGAARIFGNFKTSFSSMAIRPSTGRIYIGVQGGARTDRGLYRMAADGSDFEKIFEESVDQVFFYDDCWIDFDPSNDGIIYVTTGFDNQVRMFAVGGAYLGTLGSYEDIGIPTDQLSLPHDEGYWLPHQCFVPAGGGDYHLLMNVHHVPAGDVYNVEQQKRLIALDPDLNSFLGELPLAGPSLILPNRVLGMVHDDVSGKLYSGGNGYADVFEIAADYSSYQIIFNPPGMPDATHTRVAVSYGHSVGADADADGLTDDDETGIYMTDPLDADSDDDGLFDGEESTYWGANWNTNYDGDGITNNLLDPDSDNDSFSDALEVSAGTDPASPDATLPVWRVSFQPSSSTRPVRFAPDNGVSYSYSRGYGW